MNKRMNVLMAQRGRSRERADLIVGGNSGHRTSVNSLVESLSSTVYSIEMELIETEMYIAES